MPSWNELTPEQQQQVVQALRANAQRAGVTVNGEVKVSGEGGELVIPASAV